MGLGDVWNRTLVYFGIAEDEEWDDDLTVTNEEVERDYRRRDRQNVRRLRELTEAHGLTELSMGTSQDWRVAVDEGATLIRVGSVVFGR